MKLCFFIFNSLRYSNLTFIIYSVTAAVQTTAR